MGWSIDLIDPDTKEAAEVEPFFYGSNVLIGYVRHESSGSDVMILSGEIWTRADDPRVAEAKALREQWKQDCFMDFDGTVVLVTGQTQGHLSLTSNYRDHFDAAVLRGKTGEETTEMLNALVKRLGTDPGPDYWKSAPGNAGIACALLLSWAEKYPAAIWDVSC